MPVTHVSLNPRNQEVLWQGNLLDKIQLSKILSKDFKVQSDIQSKIKDFAERLKQQKNTLAETISLETGKLLPECLAEVDASYNRTIALLEQYKLNYQHSQSSLTNERSITVKHRGIGITLVIGPFNYPLSLPNSQIVASLLASNPVIFKPSLFTPWVGDEYLKILRSAGISPTELECCHLPNDLVADIYLHPSITGIWFTGSYSVASMIAKNLADAKMFYKMFAAEMGGNNALIVSDYEDIDSVIDIVFKSAFISTGQRCTCTRRLIIVKDVADKVIRHLKTTMHEKNWFEFMGPLISPQSKDNFIHVVSSLKKIALDCIEGNTSLPHFGNYVNPVCLVLDKADLEKIDDEELFAPLLKIFIVDSFDEAVELANKTKYGLVGGIISNQKNIIDFGINNLQVGNISINVPTTGSPPNTPFTGLACSGNFRPAGMATLQSCLTPQVIQSKL